jgi:hypothetical protein
MKIGSIAEWGPKVPQSSTHVTEDRTCHPLTTETVVKFLKHAEFGLYYFHMEDGTLRVTARQRNPAWRWQTVS